MTTALPLQHRCVACGEWWAQAHVCRNKVIFTSPDVPSIFSGMNLKVECKTCGQTVPANTVHHCPGGRILTEAEVRRIVREELADAARSKPSTDIAVEPQTKTCGACKWWGPWKIDATTGACNFPILMPASRTYPVDKTPMHETEGDDCRCFERKEG